MISTLVDILSRFEAAGAREAVRYNNGFTSKGASYRELAGWIGAFANYLSKRRIGKGDRIVLWGENRIGWLIAFWGAVIRGVELVPIDANLSPEFVSRVCNETNPALIVHGADQVISQFSTHGIVLEEIERLAPREPSPVEVDPDQIVEIVFTSGTTGNPKGVVHRHKNICANLRPIEKEIARYSLWIRIFQPFRILNLLPLSHLFGQSMSLFIPPLLQGSSVLTDQGYPRAIARVLKTERVSVLVAVPQIAGLLAHFLLQQTGRKESSIRTSGIPSIAERWWKFRTAHSLTGWKFWAVVLGGARVSPTLEEQWSRMGFLTVQGYGLTEASPIVALNHPLRARKGSLGKVLEGQEVRIASDGEILVRGPNIVSEYLRPPEDEEAAEDGWLHTGDIGEINEEGYLLFRGRKKDVIVTSSGLNIFPDDVEASLNKLTEVEESAVVGVPTPEGDVVHAVLVLNREDVDVSSLIHKANQTLESHQRIKSWSVWPGERLPRTPSTQKIRRGEILSQLTSGPEQEDVQPLLRDDLLVSVLSRLSGTEPAGILPDKRLSEDLGLTSLDRVELFSRLEQQGVPIDETNVAVAETVSQVRAFTAQSSGGSDVERASRPREPAQIDFPRWASRFPVRQLRSLVQNLVAVPLFKHYMSFSTIGLDTLSSVSGPVIFAANHSSHLDTIAILAALPPDWRWRIAPAMLMEHFAVLFEGNKKFSVNRFLSSVEYTLACALFNAFPFPQRSGGIRQAAAYAGQLVSKGYCPLIFPEGLRTPDGELQPFKPGVAYLASVLELPVIPVAIHGLFQVMPSSSNWPERGTVKVEFGKPKTLSRGSNFSEFVTQVESEVRASFDDGPVTD